VSAEKIFRAHRIQGPYFFLEAFFLPFFFALAMLALQLRVSPGSKYTHANQKNKQARSLCDTHAIDALTLTSFSLIAHHNNERMNFQ
jgi:hypothetical protein